MFRSCTSCWSGWFLWLPDLYEVSVFMVEVKNVIRLVWNPLYFLLRGLLESMTISQCKHEAPGHVCSDCYLGFFWFSIPVLSWLQHPQGLFLLMRHTIVYWVRLSCLIFTVLSGVCLPLFNGKEPSLFLISPVFFSVLCTEFCTTIKLKTRNLTLTFFLKKKKLFGKA